ncbi:MAG: 1-(5-phosphoribosyl)-5-[(5-phosphoribosylamino)methylideneamino]imidazole-4-carboxamide isomerase [Lachnospiraceae bacterium]|nr:1-(5-phosphoribosyl)-5-[(5-phosphoribosylamino)methylideneamino]imidazole-4-carboxamide isomerase [Lachnospiraceae bacterium]
MQLYPAIDLKDGKCVRLSQGSFNDVKVYSDSPALAAAHWEGLGATFLHIVDLDGAVKGSSVNREAIKDIGTHISIPFEVGGGVRTLQDIEELLGLGAKRVIIGTKAVEDPDFAAQAVERFGADHIVLGLDARDGKVAVKGWLEDSVRSSEEFCLDMKKAGIRTVIYTDISRDGMLCGPNITNTRKLIDSTGMEIIASGGISCMDDLAELKKAGIPGAILGKALYEGRIDLAKAICTIENPSDFSEFKTDGNGLIPVVVQDDETLEVLMVAYMNEEAYKKTLLSGRMHYYSRSRQTLWLKGETSGHFQDLVSLDIDCDNDTLLARVIQTGAACHTGNHSCFYRRISDKAI